MRCPSCSKFVSFAEPEVELSGSEADGDDLRGDVHIALNCAECGETLKEADLTAEHDLSNHICDMEMVVRHQLKSTAVAELDADAVDTAVADRLFVIVDETAEPLERTQTTDDKGRAIRNPRYQKRFYGAAVTWTVECSACGGEIHASSEVEEQASAFDEVA